MSKRYPGGLITKTPVVPTSLSAPGVWSLSDQADAQATNTWPFPRDPQFRNVTMLLHGDGSAGPVAATGVGAGVSTTVTNFNADASTNNFNVTINGDARSNNFTPYQGAGYYSNYFGGSGNSINYPSASQYAIGTGNFTVEFFVNFASLNAGHNRMFCIGASGTDGLELDLNGTNLEVGIQNGYPIGYTWTPTTNTWYYVAVTRSGSAVTLYINGTSVATGTSSNSISQNSLSIGGISWVGSWSINGYLSNVRLSNTVRTIATPTTPYTSDANTLFLGAQSNRFLDNSSYAATATPTGSPSVNPLQPFTLPSGLTTYGSGFFDGSGDWLTAPSNAGFGFGTGDFTIEGWVYWTGGSNENTFFCVDVTGGANIFLSSGGNWGIGTRGIVINNNFGTPPTQNVWHHLAVSRSGSTIYAFIDGALVFSGANSVNYATGSPSIAAIPTVAGYIMSGYISNLRVVKGTAVYTSAFTPPTSPLTAITNTQLLTTQYNGGGNNSGFKDSSQFNFPITRNGNTTQGTFTPYGANWSNYITGGAYETVPQNTAFSFGTGDFTVEFWINLNSYRTSVGGYYDCFVALGNYTNSPYFRVTPTGKPDVGLVSVGMTGSTTLQLRTWYHFAAVRSGTSAKLYINGVLDASVTSSDSLGNSSAVYIGTSQWGVGNEYMDGYISNIRIIKGTALYTAAFTPSVVPLTAITGTSLLTCQANSFKDSSTNNFAITPSGSPSVQRFSPFAPLTVYNPTTYGGSAYFDGNADFLTAPQSSAFNIGTGTFTVEAWVYLNGIYSSGGTSIINLGNGANGGGPFTGWGLIIDYDAGGSTAYPAWYRYDGSVTQYTSSVSLKLNQWYHLAVARDSSNNFAIWVNGSRVYSGTSTVSFNNVNSDPLNIGKRINGSANSPNYLNGYMADGRVVIGSSLYNPTATTITVPTAPLTAVTNTQFLLNYTNPAILDNAMMNDLETVGNAAVSTSVKKYGAASMYFEGTSPYGYLKGNANLSQNVAFGTGDFTVECWVYLTTTASDSTIMDTRPGSNSANYFLFYLWTNGGAQQPTIAWYSPTSYVLSTGTVSSGTWTHIAVSRASGTIRSFKDGVLQQSASDTRSYANPGAPYPYIGAAYGVGVDSFKGYIDDFRITKYARYTANFTVPDQAFPNG